MEGQIFLELGAIVLVTTVIAGVLRLLKQPLIIAYIASGIIVSPHVLDLVKHMDAIATFSQLGIAFLLFMVGLSLNPKVIRDVGKISLITGLGQVIFTSLIGYLIATAFGFNTIEALYIATALTFSSTIVIMKLLSDKKDLDTLYGRISVGFLIIQDIVAMLILIFVSSLSGDQDSAQLIINTVVKGAGLIGLTAVSGYYLLPYLTKRIADNQELLILFSISWCFVLASICHLLGFSFEIGALLAGISLSVSPYRHEIANKIKPLRDFFILMFFVFLGTQLEFGQIDVHIWPIIIFSLFILIGNPLIVVFLMGRLKYSKRTGFLAGLTVAQISEFSLILVALGVKMEHLSADILSLVTIVGLITIGGSTYFIIHGEKIYKYLSRFLVIFERSDNLVDKNHDKHENSYDLILIGYDHLGKNLINELKRMGNSILVLDYNPEIIADLKEEGINCRFADVEDTDVFDELNIADTKMIISSVRSPKINKEIIHRIEQLNPECITVILSESKKACLELYEHGASFVITPELLTRDHILDIIDKHGFDHQKFLDEKVNYMEKLEMFIRS